MAVFADCLACRRIDELHRFARKTADAHRDIVVGSFRLIVIRSKTLHSEARIRATQDKWRHSAF
jgi:hypothetical protein